MKLKLRFLFLRSLLIPLALILLCPALTGCASSDEEEFEEIEERQSVVDDPVSFEVTGISGDLYDNVVTHLNAMPAISKKRVFIFRRELRNEVELGLRALGYYNPTIDIELPARDVEEDRTVTVKVDAGKPIYVRNCNVEILGEGADYKVFKDLIESSGLNSYSVLSHSNYEALKSSLNSTALSLGFFDANYIASRIMIYQEQNAADIELVYDTGRRYHFGDLKYDEKTAQLLKPSQSLVTIGDGGNFSTKAINDFSNSLNQTGYYRSVDVRPLLDEASDLKVPVEIALERKSKNIMRVGIGYSTDEGPKILGEWEKPLLNEYGHSFSARAEISQVSQEASAIYKIPRDNPNTDYYYINASQTHIDLNDTLADRSHLSFHYVDNDRKHWRRDWALKAEYEDYEQGADEGYGWNLMPSLVLSRRESSGGFDPKFGYSINLDVSAATAAISDYTFLRMVAVIKSVFSPTENTRVVTRLQQGAIFGPDSTNMPATMRFFAGGDSSIRGYGYLDESPTNSGGLNGARYLTTGTVELQFPCGIDNSRLAVFLDGGTATDDYKDDILWGPGFGYRYVSPYGTVRVDLGFGIDKDPTDIRLHFAFGPEF